MVKLNIFSKNSFTSSQLIGENFWHLSIHFPDQIRQQFFNTLAADLLTTDLFFSPVQIFFKQRKLGLLHF